MMLFLSFKLPVAPCPQQLRHCCLLENIFISSHLQNPNIHFVLVFIIKDLFLACRCLVFIMNTGSSFNILIFPEYAKIASSRTSFSWLSSTGSCGKQLLMNTAAFSGPSLASLQILTLLMNLLSSLQMWNSCKKKLINSPSMLYKQFSLLTPPKPKWCPSIPTHKHASP